MELARLPVRQERRRVAPIVFGLIVAVVAVWVVVGVVTDRSPEETVEDYLEAVAEKDVEGALALVTWMGYGVPYGRDARFLTPEAISDDWWVVSVTEADSSATRATVRAVLAGPDGTAAGDFELYEDDGEWMLTDPFAEVAFPASPLSYIRVNDQVVEQEPGPAVQVSYSLFPGLYRFYGSAPGVMDTEGTEPVLAFPEDEETKVVVPPALTAGEKTTAKLAASVRRRLDECAGFATPAPYGGCPFATDGEVDTPDGKRVDELHGLKWTVVRYPVVELVDDRSDDHLPGFAMKTTEPGAVTLTGAGVDTDDNPTTFTVTCEVDMTGLYGVVDADGNVTLSTGPRYNPDAGDTDTCRHQP